MSLKKKYLKSKPLCKVTFNLPEKNVNGAKRVSLLGDFNDWNARKATDMRKLKDGSFTRTLDLEVGKSYQFRYLVDGERWINDPQADRYAASGVDYSQNCIVEV
jgi:1,4-alpha-glucan branching enzyme